ncbi:MAG: hypothetical protein JSV96_08425 [Candidatus Aminicenantes bacterium]|nr:MAG: hypothetical protein JSV96_08425 [Candidatus Aminicenantes bacterium]
MKAEDIRSKVTSENLSILKRSLLFVDDRLALLRERGKQAETRATAMLAVSSILAGFVVHFGKSLEKLKLFNSVLFAALYLAVIFFIIKSIYYSIKALWVLKGNELNTDLVFELQDFSESEAARYELTWKIWEYWQYIPLTNEKLFWLNRSQRNTVAALITYMFLGMVLYLEMKLGFSSYWIVNGLAVVFLVSFVLFIDIAMERLGNVWKK